MHFCFSDDHLDGPEGDRPPDAHLHRPARLPSTRGRSQAATTIRRVLPRSRRDAEEHRRRATSDGEHR